MAIAANSVSLADYALTSNSPPVRAVTYSLILSENVMQDVPLINSESLVANGVRFEGNLPTVNWSPLNAEGVTTKGTPTAYSEQAYTFRNNIDVDKVFVRDKNAIVGIKYRIANGGVFGVRPENLIDGGGTDLSLAGMTQATANKFLVYLDQLLWSVDSPEGTGVTLYMNEVLKRQMAAAVRVMGTSGGFATVKDQFDRSIDMYKGATIRDIGYKKDQLTRIIPGNGVSGSGAVGELNTGVASTGASAVYTSIYAVNYGTDHFFGWQFDDINVQDLGLINNGVIYRTFIDWIIGFMNQSTRSLGRLYDLKIA